jgi:methyltransferase (TIGR00027 family)
MMRSEENSRVDRLFHDPLASVFASAVGAATSLSSRIGTSDGAGLEQMAAYLVVVRSRFFDDQLRRACAAGVRQVVLLGAGLDSRAFRLAWPAGTRVFELDLPELFEFKESVLAASAAQPLCARTVVGFDLRGQWCAPLLAAGFDPTVETAWLAEGLLHYMPAPDRDRLLRTVSENSAAGSHLFLDFFSKNDADLPGVRAASNVVDGLGARLSFAASDPREWLAEYGWRADRHRISALGAEYGRPLPVAVHAASVDANVLTAAVRHGDAR